ncbi:MAG: hypothetical protein ACKV0T_26610 [Planctomycetales bacterium]
MQRWIVCACLASLIVAGAGWDLADAAGPGGNTSIRNRRGPAKTVTTTTVTSPELISNIQYVDPATGQTVAVTVTFTATYQTVTETTRIFCWTRTRTSSSLTFSGTGLPDGTGVVFNVLDTQNNDGELIPGGGSAVFSNNQVSLHLATANGDTVPTVTQGDVPTVEIDLFGQTFGPFDANPFGAPQTTVTTSGRR